MMKNEKKPTTIWTVTICGCLCLLAVGTGLVWQTLESNNQPSPTSVQEQVLTPVTVVQTPTLDESKLERDKMSNDAGEDPDGGTTSQATVSQSSVSKTTEPETPTETNTEKPVFALPIVGEVIMPYSVDTAIYDPTLEQYRTNDSISVSAEIGSEVQSAEAGVVKEITVDEERGTSVVISHNDAWVTTYSQLAPEVFVAVGETVSKGQKIGTVAEPTKYTISLGSHLEFAVQKDGTTVDPQSIITNE